MSPPQPPPQFVPPKNEKNTREGLVYRHAFLSHAAAELTEEDIQKLENQATNLFSRYGVRALSVFTGKRFVQVLEGDKDVVRDVVAQIESDPRHHMMKTFSMESGLKPFLKSPGTFVSNVNDIPNDMRLQLDKMLGRYQWSQNNLRIPNAEVGFLRSLAIFAFE